MATKTYSFNRKLIFISLLPLAAGVGLQIWQPNFTLAYWGLYIAALFAAITHFLRFRTLIIADKHLEIRKLWREEKIDREKISSFHKQTFFHGGVESITWTMALDNGRKVRIINDTFKDFNRLKEDLNWFLRDIPREEAIRQ